MPDKSLTMSDGSSPRSNTAPRRARGEGVGVMIDIVVATVDRVRDMA